MCWAGCFRWGQWDPLRGRGKPLRDLRGALWDRRDPQWVELQRRWQAQGLLCWAEKLLLHSGNYVYFEGFFESTAEAAALIRCVGLELRWRGLLHMIYLRPKQSESKESNGLNTSLQNWNVVGGENAEQGKGG